jgi:hypothetical protein
MPSIINATTSTGLVSSADNSGSLQLATNSGTTALTIDTSQNVGIGTSSPAARLDVRTTSSTQATFTRTGQAAVCTLYQSSADTYLSATNSGANLILATQDVERMRIDSSGRVTMPYQPVFGAYGSQGSLANGSTCIAGGVDVNIGSNYNASNGRFTAPIAGTYYFIGTNQWNGTTNGYYYGFQFKKNTLFVGQGIFQVTNSANDNSCTQAIILTLAANDYVIMTTYTQSTPTTTFTNFAGYLIG